MKQLISLDRPKRTWIPQDSKHAYVHGVRKREQRNMIREDCKGLNMTLQEAGHMMRDWRVWRAAMDERLSCVMALPGP